MLPLPPASSRKFSSSPSQDLPPTHAMSSALVFGESIFINFVILFLTYFAWYGIYTVAGVPTPSLMEQLSRLPPCSDNFPIPCASLAALQHLSSCCLIKVCLYLLSFSRSKGKDETFLVSEKKKNIFSSPRLLIYRLIWCRKLLRRAGSSVICELMG